MIKQSLIDELKGLEVAVAMGMVETAGHKAYLVPEGVRAISAEAKPNTVVLWHQGGVITSARAGDPFDLDLFKNKLSGGDKDFYPTKGNSEAQKSQAARWQKIIDKAVNGELEPSSSPSPREFTDAAANEARKHPGMGALPPPGREWMIGKTVKEINIISELEEHLSTMENPDAPIVHCGDRILSSRDSLQEMKKGSDLGLELLKAYSKLRNND